MEVVQELCVSLESSEGEMIEVWIPVGYATLDDATTIPLTRDTVFADQQWLGTPAYLVSHYQSLLNDHMIDMHRVASVQKCLNVC